MTKSRKPTTLKAPRRMHIGKRTPAETAISEAMHEVENMGADPLLTEAVIHLNRAFNCAADFTDGTSTGEFVFTKLEAEQQGRIKSILKTVREQAEEFKNMALMAIVARDEFGRGSNDYKRASDAVRIFKEVAKRLRKVATTIERAK